MANLTYTAKKTTVEQQTVEVEFPLFRKNVEEKEFYRYDETGVMELNFRNDGYINFYHWNEQGKYYGESEPATVQEWNEKLLAFREWANKFVEENLVLNYQ